ncbi:hypothetical protein D7027_09830 [Ochrobactrum intermedium]|uniref:hypothetical protein n=1 Tax=Brucella intermedia TaxID=94625 RepID=UPI000FDF49E1|nr:hypothetical protein [Brucella intermedia]MPR62106.1 hypothetical protein [Brucella intermedia]
MPVRLKAIPGPKREGKYSDRSIDCQEAVAATVIDIIEQAENAGWSATETAKAINQVSRGLFVGHSGTDRHE